MNTGVGASWVKVVRIDVVNNLGASGPEIFVTRKGSDHTEP